MLAEAQGGKSVFLRCYAMYLAGEKRKQYVSTLFEQLAAALWHEMIVLVAQAVARGCPSCCREERVEASGALGKAQVMNKELDALETQLEAAQRAGSADAFCSYLYGLLLIDRYGCAQCAS